jgi:hypothetical protein
MNIKIKSFIRSRRVWATIAGILTAVFRDTLGFSSETVLEIMGLVGLWVLGDSYRKTE